MPLAFALTMPPWVRRLFQTALMPMVALLSVQIVIIIAAVASSVSPFRGATYARYDSYHYLSIATRGYYVEMDADGRVVGGNVGWFPGYSLVIRALKPRRVTPAKVGKVVSTVFAFALLAVLWSVLSAQEQGAPRVLSLLLAAFFPGFIYYHSVFPIAMAASLDLLALVLCARGRFFSAGILGALAATTYPTGFLVAVALAVAIVLDRESSPRARVAAFLGGPLLVGLGLAAVSLYQARTVGWNAFLRIRTEYFDNSLSNPLATFVSNTSHVWHADWSLETLPHLQTLLVAMLVLLTCGLCWRDRQHLTRLDTLLLTNTLTFWIFPLTVGVFGATRADALLVGMVPLLARLPRSARAVLLAVFVSLGTGICILFFQRVLV